MELTPEQIDLDLMHYKLDHPEKFKEVFVDASFEAYEKSLDEDGDDEDGDEEQEASEEPTTEAGRPSVRANSADDWEDIPEEEL